MSIGSWLGLMGLNIPSGVLTGLSLICGLVALQYGYRLFRFFIFLAGFVAGTVVIGFFADAHVALLGGILAGAICCMLWYLGVFVLGAIAGMLIALALGVKEQVVVIFVAAIFGVLAIAIRKFMIIVSTSLFGAGLVMSAISEIPEIGGRLSGFSEVAGLIVLAVIGVITQYKTASNEKKKDESPVVNDEPRQPDEKPQTEGHKEDVGKTPIARMVAK